MYIVNHLTGIRKNQKWRLKSFTWGCEAPGTFYSPEVNRKSSRQDEKHVEGNPSDTHQESFRLQECYSWVRNRGRPSTKGVCVHELVCVYVCVHSPYVCAHPFVRRIDPHSPLLTRTLRNKSVSSFCFVTLINSITRVKISKFKSTERTWFWIYSHYCPDFLITRHSSATIPTLLAIISIESTRPESGCKSGRN